MSLEFTQPLMNVFGLQGFHIKSNFSCKFGVTERVGALLNAAERALCRRRRRIPAFALPVKFRMLVLGLDSKALTRFSEFCYCCCLLTTTACASMQHSRNLAKILYLTPVQRRHEGTSNCSRWVGFSVKTATNRYLPQASFK